MSLYVFSFVKNLKGIVLETYGSGNAPSEEWFLNEVEKEIKQNILQKA